MEERTGIPAIDDAAYLRGMMDDALRRGFEEGLRDYGLVPPAAEREIVQKISAVIPFAQEIRGEFVPVSRCTLLRWKLRAFSLGDWIHDRLFPECARRWEDHVC
jgi:hypothetical protein